MASKINATNIDITYPVAGQDNDTQGFRTNFTNIRNNLNTAGLEISAIQANIAVLQGSQTYQFANLSSSSNVTIGTASYITILDGITGTIATANIFLPSSGALTNGQVVSLTANVAITTVTVYPGTNTTIGGAPASYSANQTDRWLYSTTTQRWYKI